MSVTDPHPFTTPTTPPGFAEPGDSEPTGGGEQPDVMLDGLVEQLAGNESLDMLAMKVGNFASMVGESEFGAALRGRHLGHAIHPILAALPLACFTSANLLDLFGGRSARPASRRLIGFGLLAVAPTALAGMAEYDRIDDPGDRRVGAAHAAGNWAMTGAYLMSWRARRKDHQVRGVLWGLIGGGISAGAGALGAHLALRKGVGVGERGRDDSSGRGISDEHVHAAIGESLSTEAYYG